MTTDRTLRIPRPCASPPELTGEETLCATCQTVVHDLRRVPPERLVEVATQRGVRCAVLAPLVVVAAVATGCATTHGRHLGVVPEQASTILEEGVLELDVRRADGPMAGVLVFEQGRRGQGRRTDRDGVVRLRPSDDRAVRLELRHPRHTLATVTVPFDRRLGGRITLWIDGAPDHVRPAWPTPPPDLDPETPVIGAVEASWADGLAEAAARDEGGLDASES